MMIKWITSGLNYFGYINNEFSPIGWKDAKNDVTKLLGIADRQAQNINSLLKSIQFTNLMENQRQLFTKGMLVPVRNELDETKRRQRLEEMQKRKAIRVRTITVWTLNEWGGGRGGANELLWIIVGTVFK